MTLSVEQLYDRTIREFINIILQMADLVSLTVFPKAHLPHVPKVYRSKTHKMLVQFGDIKSVRVYYKLIHFFSIYDAFLAF